MRMIFCLIQALLAMIRQLFYSEVQSSPMRDSNPQHFEQLVLLKEPTKPLSNLTRFGH